MNITNIESDILARANIMHAAECPCGKDVSKHRHWLTVAAGWLTYTLTTLESR